MANVIKDDKLYLQWAVIDVVRLFEENRWSVLHKLPDINGQNIVNAVVKPLAINNLNKSSSVSNISTTSDNSSNNDILNNSNNCSYLKTDRDVQWVMEVICYGLCLPINTTEQHEAVRDCVNIYCEWMHALVPSDAESKSIPLPILEDPNHYYRLIIQHLYNIFIPRISSSLSTSTNTSQDLNSNDIISRQALLCHRVLRKIMDITKDKSNIMDHDTWEILLLFLLSINNALLGNV